MSARVHQIQAGLTEKKKINRSVKQGEKSHVEQHHINYNNLFHNPHCLYSRSSQTTCGTSKSRRQNGQPLRLYLHISKEAKDCNAASKVRTKISSSSK